MQNKLYLSLLGFVISFTITAQTYHHTTLWSRLAFQKSIEKWDFKVEYDFRQQNDFEKSMNNPFQKPLLRWLRAYTIYNTGNFSHSLVLPNWIKSYPLVSNEPDLKKSANVEWRYGFFEEYERTDKWLSSSIRLGYEFRNIHLSGQVRNTGRLRIRISEEAKIAKRSNLIFSFEPLYNINPNKSPNTFSQYQLNFRYSRKFGKHTFFTTGINHLLRKRSTLVEYDLENALISNLLITI